MRIGTLYRCLLLLPLVVPALLLPLGLFHLAPSWLERFIAVCGLSVMVGGIPYALLALCLLLWMRGKPERQVRMAMFITPALMVAFLGLAIVTTVALEGSPFDSDNLTAWAVYSGYALMLGYFYVALACLIVWLARRTGRMENDGGTQATAGVLEGGISGERRAPAAPDAER
jgi:uncharacterized membrane protein YkvI